MKEKKFRSKIGRSKYYTLNNSQTNKVRGRELLKHRDGMHASHPRPPPLSPTSPHTKQMEVELFRSRLRGADKKNKADLD